MIWLWILGILVVFLTLFCLVPIGVRILFGKPILAKVTIGPIRIQIAPSKSKKKKKTSLEKAKKNEKPHAFLEKLKNTVRPSLRTLKSAYHTLKPPVKRAIKKTLHGIKIDPLLVSVTLGGKEDPAQTAEIYGIAESVIWTVMPTLEQIMKIPHPKIHLGVNFDTEKTDVQGEIGVSIRIGTLIAVGIEIGIPTLCWLLKHRKELKKQRKETNDRKTAPDVHPAA